MKRIAISILGILLLLALCVPALAEPDVLVVLKDGTKVYAEPSTDAEVYGKLKKGDTVLVEQRQGGRVAKLVSSPDGEGQTYGWIQAENLGCKHEWSDWKVETEATCSAKGVKTRVCSRCGEKQSKDIDKLPHEYGKWTVESEPTCTEEGQRSRKCQVCGYVDKQAVKKLPHEYGEWTILWEPTCTEEGQRSHVCQVCGYKESTSIPKLPHEYSEWSISVPATDHSSGMRAHTCLNCGYTEETAYDPEGTLRPKAKGQEVREMQQLLADQGYMKARAVDGSFGSATQKALKRFQKDQGLEPDGIAWPQTLKRLKHEFGPWTIVTPLTRTGDGERVRTCTDCGYEQRETFPAAPAFVRKQRKNNGVKGVQGMLNDLGYNAGRADGAYGPKLDAAFKAFASDRNQAFEPGALRPCDVDDLVNSWIEMQPDSLWKGKGDKNSPVSLVLSVTPSETAVADGFEGVRTFDWTLTNLGTEKCQFNAILLNFGDDPDYRHDNFTVVIDADTLKADARNTLSGSFSVSTDWGEGDLHFSAVGTSAKSGEKWLSNTETVARGN